jgi:hypothetical protein
MAYINVINMQISKVVVLNLFPHGQCLQLIYKQYARRP